MRQRLGVALVVVLSALTGVGGAVLAAQDESVPEAAAQSAALDFWMACGGAPLSCVETDPPVTTVVETVTTGPTPPPPPPTDEPVYGIANGAEITSGRSAADRAKELDGTAALGLTAIRIDAPWSYVESTQGARNWTRIDDVVRDARSGCGTGGRCLDVLITLGYAPSWANGGFGDNHYAPVGSTNRQLFANFARDAVLHFWPMGVRWFEIWNEPNHAGFWKPNVNAINYTDLLKRSYAAIKAAQPEAVVLGGAIAGVGGSPHVYPTTFLEQMFANGAKGNLDALSVHPYIENNQTIYWSSWAWADGGSWFGAPRSVLNTWQANEPGKKIWFTETGDTRLSTTSTSTVPKIMNQLRAYQDAGWGGPAFWYAYRSIDSYSLVDSAWNPRPAWFVLQDWVATH